MGVEEPAEEGDGEEEEEDAAEEEDHVALALAGEDDFAGGGGFGDGADDGFVFHAPDGRRECFRIGRGGFASLLEFASESRHFQGEAAFLIGELASLDLEGIRIVAIPRHEVGRVCDYENRRRLVMEDEVDKQGDSAEKEEGK